MASVVMLRPGRHTPDGRQVFRLFPGSVVRDGKPNCGGRFLYALGYADGRTKIGIARHPRSRMYHHWAACDGAIQWGHLFAHFDDRTAARIERRALVVAAEASQRIRLTETFRNLSRTEAIRCVRQAIEEQGG